MTHLSGVVVHQPVGPVVSQVRAARIEPRLAVPIRIVECVDANIHHRLIGRDPGQAAGCICGRSARVYARGGTRQSLSHAGGCAAPTPRGETEAVGGSNGYATATASAGNVATPAEITVIS